MKTLILAVYGALTACAPHQVPRPQPVPCDHGRCPDAHSCRYRRVADRTIGECRLELGRCYADFDCAPHAQRCRRFSEQPGVCVTLGR